MLLPAYNNNVNLHRDDASFTSSKIEPCFEEQLANTMHASGLVAAKKDCSWCLVSTKNESVFGVVVWQKVGGDGPYATAPLFFLCPVSQNHIALVEWLTTKEIHLG